MSRIPSTSERESKIDFVLGIPTRNRPEKLRSTLASISRMKYTPAFIVVCDSSDESYVESVTRFCELSKVSTFLIRSEKASIPFQRNRIVDFCNNLNREFEFLLFLDDDTEPDYLYSHLLIDFLVDNPSYGGACGVTQFEKRSRIADWFGSLFLVNGIPGHVLPSGVAIPPDRSSITGFDSEWIFGCSMWRRSVLSDFRWQESWDGYAAGEDVYFSFSVSKFWKLRVLPLAKIVNSYAEEGRPTSLQLARMTVNHRWEIAQLHEKNKVYLFSCVVWSVIGEICFSLLNAITKFDIRQLKAIKGYFSGLFDILQPRN